MKISFGLVIGLVLSLFAIGVLFFVFRKYGDKFNPASDKNVAYQGVNKIVQDITGEKDTSLGSKIFDWINPSQALANTETIKVKPKQKINGIQRFQPKPDISVRSKQPETRYLDFLDMNYDVQKFN